MNALVCKSLQMQAIVIWQSSQKIEFSKKLTQVEIDLKTNRITNGPPGLIS